MSFPRYPEYKDSGVEWLGEVPRHWQTLRLRWLCGEPIRNGVGEASDQDDPLNPRYIRITDISDSRNLRDDTFKSLPPEVATAAPLKVGDLLFAAVGATYGKSYLHCRDIGPACFAGYLVKFTPANSVAGGFIAYWTESAHYWTQVNSRVIQSTVQNFSASKFRELIAPFPPFDEQQAIVTFLDRETAKIDALVAEQEKLIALLKEKRHAVISHAVTKGLDPDVPMKDSGIEWLGEVPAHWDLLSSRRMFVVRSEPALASDKMLTVSQKYGVLFQSDFVEAEGRRVVEVIMGKDSLRHVEPDDFIISMRSFQGGIEWCKLRGSTSFHYVMLRPIKGVHPPFFAHLFKSVAYIQALRATTDLIRDGQELRYSHFVQVDLPLVPLEEQARIATFLDHELAKLDALAVEAEHAIDLLKERRSALISAAVTGKIDVRGAARLEAAA